jgi:hypothetical protein
MTGDVHATVVFTVNRFELRAGTIPPPDTLVPSSYMEKLRNLAV